jgi:transposase
VNGVRLVRRIELSERDIGELESLFRSSPSAKVRDRAQAVLMAHRKRPREQIAEDLCVTPRTVRRWLRLWQQGRTAGLEPAKPPGAAGRIPEHLAQEVRNWVIEGPPSRGLGLANWSHETLAEHLGRSHGIRIKRSAMGRFCRRHDIRPYRPTYRYLRGDPGKQAAAGVELASLQ